MKPVSNVVVLAVLAVLAVIGLHMNSRDAIAATAPGTAPVTVQNTSANPVPVTGTASVSGSVAATQSGSWSVGITGTPTVNIANGATSPVLVSPMDGPGHTPVQGLFSNTNNQYTVPSDKRLVIEYVSGECFGDAASTGTIVDGFIETHVGGFDWDFSAPTIRPASNAILRFAGAVHVYADPGSKVKANYLFTGDITATCGGNFAGYLTNP